MNKHVNDLSLSMDQRLEIISSLWTGFSSNMFHELRFSANMIDTDPEVAYLYSFHSITRAQRWNEIPRSKTNLKRFRIFESTMLGMTEPIGYAIFPIRKSNLKFRYTPRIIVATSKDATAEVMKHNVREVVFSNNKIEALQDNVGTEIITRIGFEMEVSLVGLDLKDERENDDSDNDGEGTGS